MKVTRRYCATLENYLLWRVGNFLRSALDQVTEDTVGPSPELWMMMKESTGESAGTCSDVDKLRDYMQGKTSRDWHISEWRDGIKRGYFYPVEFVRVLGTTDSDMKRLHEATQ